MDPKAERPKVRLVKGGEKRLKNGVIRVEGDGDTNVLCASAGDDTVAWHENDESQGFTKHVIVTSADGASSVFAI